MNIKNIILLLIVPIIFFSLALKYAPDDGSFGFDGYQGAFDLPNTPTATVAQTTYGDEFNSLFELYEKIYKEENTAFEQKIENHWGESKTSTKYQWVSYVENGNVRRTVDYETGELKVELQLQDSALVRKNVINKLEKEVFKLLNSTEVDAFRADEVAQNVEARLPANHRMIKRGAPRETPLFDLNRLTSVSFNHSGIMNVSNSNTLTANTTAKEAKVPGKILVQSSLFVDKKVLQKAIQYVDVVQKFSHEQKISAALVYAIMESESSFNPLAKSHIPAYGLMQIVPRSAGIDATKHLYGKPKILAPSYLYSSDNNINIGAAYLHVLYHKYLSRVEDPQSRIYCAIAAYNTGASNVARAFIKQRNFNRAVKHINQMSPDQVYQALVKRLPFRETRKYVKKVTNNMEKYLTTHPETNQGV